MLVVAPLVAVASVVGCSLVTSLDGLSGGPLDTVDGGPDVAAATEAGGPDGGVDAPLGDAAMEGDAPPGMDATTKVGTVYVLGGATDNGNSAAVYAADIHTDGLLGAWSTLSSLPEWRTYPEAIVGSGFLAVVGGSSPSGDLTSTLIAKTQATGLGAWSALGQFAIPRIRHGAALANDRLYVLGGTDATDTAIADVQFATISPSAIGDFTATSPLPAPRSRIAVAATSKFVYVFGGSDAMSAPVAEVDRAPINADGTLGAFEAQNALPGARTHAQATIVVPGHILVTGGEGAVNSAIVYDIDSIQGTLSAPSATLALPAPTDHHATVAFGNHVYVIGGFRNNAARLTDVLVGDVSADGTVSRWTPTTALPVALAYHTAAAL